MLANPMTSLMFSKMAVTYAVPHITWWTSPGLLRNYRTASDECARPGNEATLGELQDPVAAVLICVSIAALGAEGCC